MRGYRKECFDALLEKYPFLTLVDNDIYSKTNNISSVMAVLNKLDGCYLCEADLYITNPGIITKYQYASNILGAYCLETDDWSFQMDESGHIINYQKGNTFCYNYYGISYWTKADSARLREDFRQVYGEAGGKDYFWEFILWCSGRSAMPWKFASAGSRTSWRSTITTSLRSWIPPTERRGRYEMLRGHILTVNQNNDVARYLVEDGGKIVYVGNDLPEQYHSAEVIQLGEKALFPPLWTHTSTLRPSPLSTRV